MIAEGEVMQLAASKDMTTTEEEYLAVIFSKTAALFAAASEIGGVIAGRSGAEHAALRVYGHNIGLAFQLIDDALDYSGEAALLGKSVGDDFREGKITLPGCALEPARHARRARLLAAHIAGRRHAGWRFAQAIALMRRL